MQTCLGCGGEVVHGSAYCQFCGAVLGHKEPEGPTCPVCKASNPVETNFCVECGHPIARVEFFAPAAAARLVSVNLDGTDGEVFPIRGDQCDIGRSEGDLLFKDPHLAPRHARIVRQADGYVLTPLEARNGVYVRLQEPVALADGDQFLIGKQVLKFEVLSEVERTLRPAVEYGVVLFGTPVKPPWGRLRQLTAAGTSRDIFYLTRTEVSLGREGGDIVFTDDEFLSRRHAQIQVQDGQVTLADLGSSNGTYFRLRTPHPLRPGQMMRVGDALLRFEPG